ncbi:MAG: glycosyltransferase family 4 protein [Chloroflexota bacterium]
MRVLIVVHGYPPTHSGGAERRAERTARALARRNYQVRVLCVESATEPQSELRWREAVQDGVLVRRLYFGLEASPNPFELSYDNPWIGELVDDLIGQWHPSVLHLFSGYLMSSSVVRVASARKVPLVISLTDYWWLCHRINLLRSDGRRCEGPSPVGCARCYAEIYRRYRLPATLLPWGADRFWSVAGRIPALGQLLGVPRQVKRSQTLMDALRQADVLIAPSRYLADLYLRYGVDSQRLRVWRQGVELSQRPKRTPSEVLRVGYVGQVKQHKGVDLLLDAWSQLQGPKPRQFFLYGSDKGEEAYGCFISERIRRLKGVVWEGEFRGGEVWPVLANLDVLVVPSRWAENSPNSILEAQAVGLPVIGSNIGGIAELVQHEHNGLLFAVDSAEDLARQLQRLLDDPNLLERLSHADGRVRTGDEEVDQISALYEDLNRRGAEQLVGLLAQS